MHLGQSVLEHFTLDVSKNTGLCIHCALAAMDVSLTIRQDTIPTFLMSMDFALIKRSYYGLCQFVDCFKLDLAFISMTHSFLEERFLK